jgi:hypothetical protein
MSLLARSMVGRILNLSREAGYGGFAAVDYRPSVLPKYSTIAFTSPSEAWAPRATMFCTTAFHSAAVIRWLVTTSTA